MRTKERHTPPVTRTTVRAPVPAPTLMAIGFAASWLAMLAHNLFELPLTLLDIENSGPLLVALALFAAYWRRPMSRGVLLAILGWALLNLVVGGVVTVLPLSVLPFVPEQSPSHYLAHVVYAIGQVPLVFLAVAALRQPRTLSTLARKE